MNDVGYEDDIHIINEGDSFQRALIRGTNRRRVGRYVQHFPRLSRLDYEAMLREGVTMDDETMRQTLINFVKPGSKTWEEYMSTHQPSYRDGADGQRVSVVVPAVSAGSNQVEDAKTDGKVHQLSQCLTDTYLADKYGFDGFFLDTVRSAAASNPMNAVSMLQRAVQEKGFSDVKIVAGGFARSKARCAATVAALAADSSSVSVAIESEVIGDRLFMYGPDGAKGWFVEGPMAHATSVQAVYRMVSRRGCREPMFLLELELAILRVEIFNGEQYESGSYDVHSGQEGVSLPGISHVETTSLLALSHRVGLNTMAAMLSPVMSEAGVVVATSVRVTTKHVLVNDHVISQYPSASMKGDLIVPTVQIGRDLWAARLDGASIPWNLRRPVVNEMVFLYYHNGETALYSSPLKVLQVNDTDVVLDANPAIVPGMSGAAVLAVSDLAMLGVHCGQTLRHTIAARFGSTQHASLCEFDRQSLVSRSEASDPSSNVATKMKRKGLYPIYETVFNSIVPAFAGALHVGAAIVTKAGLSTTLDVDNNHFLFGTQRSPLMFASSGNLCQFVSAGYTGTSVVPAVTRSPNFGEQVILMSADGEGGYVSNVGNVQHVGVGGKHFTVTGFEFTDLSYVGGAVVSMVDCAVLGQYVRVQSTLDTGISAFCVPLPDLPTAVVQPDFVGFLQSRFPMLHAYAWPTSLIEEVLTHSSAVKYSDSIHPFNSGNLPLANLGDEIAKIELWKRLRELNVPHASWSQTLQRLQGNVTMAATCHRMGISDFVITGRGANLLHGSKAYADLLEALIGAVYLEEKPDVVTQFVVALGLLLDDSSVT